ncbi:MAG: LCP family protein [Actinobacteria bacterium]|nr:LCP family protein [Actinomycetota bacterium]
MRGRLTAVSVGVAVAMVVSASCSLKNKHDVVVGKPKSTTTALPGPTVVPTVPPPDLGRPPIPEPKPAVGLAGANGHPYGAALQFRSNTPIPGDLVWILVAGSDARPGEDIRHTRSDSLHLLCINPRTMQGTILGFPRDSWVQIPGHGQGKINTALALGGPQLMAETIRNLTGLPVNYYVLTGFQGIQDIVNELNCVDVYVDRRMNDSGSGARFEPGWHHFNGAEALAFSRDRHDVPNGDFSRSENQGKLILAALSKMRAEVGDEDGLETWIRVLLRHVDLDMGMSDLTRLGALARRLNPSVLNNVVVPGKVGTAGGQSVVFLGDAAANVFLDLRPDAVIGGAGPDVTTTTESTTSTTESTTTTSISTFP